MYVNKILDALLSVWLRGFARYHEPTQNTHNALNMHMKIHFANSCGIIQTIRSLSLSLHPITHTHTLTRERERKRKSEN